MTRSVRLRPWQKTAFDLFVDASDRADFLAVATPGAGKTTFALTAARHELAVSGGRLIVVAPTAHLKLQWARAAAAFSLHLDPFWSASDGGLPSDMHGIVTSYQQVAGSAATLARVSAGAFVILDELHHAGAERAWGAAVKRAFEGSRRRLALSGTPFRSDTRAIPFVTYTGEEATPDYEYGYGEALRDRRVVRPVYFPATGGEMEWSAPDGTIHTATFDDPLEATRAGQRLRTALSLDGDWLPAVLREAHTRLQAVRDEQPDAAGLVIAADQDHARGIASLMRNRLGTHAVLVTSDDPDASKRISDFAADRNAWLVAVRMVSEGVDIPRLRVGVYATTTTTELFFRQAVGRLVRWTHGFAHQPAWLFIPDDLRLRNHAASITKQRRHSLRRRDDDPVEALDAVDEPAPTDKQLSLFAAISAVALTPNEPGPADAWSDFDLSDEPAVSEIELELAPPPSLAGATIETARTGSSDAPTRHDAKRQLREANAGLARELARRTGLTHAQVNAELNRRSTIRRISEATLAQLEQRLDTAERWLETA
jgi:superfamily II DNA or RNA helicase